MAPGRGCVKTEGEGPVARPAHSSSGFNSHKTVLPIVSRTIVPTLCFEMRKKICDNITHSLLTVRMSQMVFQMFGSHIL